MGRPARAGGAAVVGAWALVIALAWSGPAVAAGPVGALVVDCSGIEGWAQEPDMPEALIDVHLYFDGPAGDPAATAVVVTANLGIDGGCMGVECMHGYRSALPMSLLDGGDHEVHAYGIDLTGDPNLELGSPGLMACPPPPIVGGELRHVVSPEVLGAWQFSVFFDRLLVADETIAGLAVGPVIDAGPQLRVDVDGEAWLIDQGFRRAVAAAVTPAWRLDPTAAGPLLPEELALPQGTALRPRPVLLQGTMLEVYLLDDHQCGVADPDPSCVPEAADDTGAGVTSDDTSGGGGGSSSEGSTSEEGSSTGTGVLTGLPPSDDDAGGGCGCRSGHGGRAWLGWSWVLIVGFALRRRGLPCRS